MASQDLKQLTFPVLRSSLFFFQWGWSKQTCRACILNHFFSLQKPAGPWKIHLRNISAELLILLLPIAFFKELPTSGVTPDRISAKPIWAVSSRWADWGGQRWNQVRVPTGHGEGFTGLARFVTSAVSSFPFPAAGWGVPRVRGVCGFWLLLTCGGRMGQKKLLKSHYLVGEKRLYYEKVLLWQKRWMCTGCLTWQQLWVSTPGEAAASRGPFRLLIFESWLQSTRRKF